MLRSKRFQMSRGGSKCARRSNRLMSSNSDLLACSGRRSFRKAAACFRSGDEHDPGSRAAPGRAEFPDHHHVPVSETDEWPPEAEQKEPLRNGMTSAVTAHQPWRVVLGDGPAYRSVYWRAPPQRLALPCRSAPHGRDPSVRRLAGRRLTLLAYAAARAGGGISPHSWSPPRPSCRTSWIRPELLGCCRSCSVAARQR